MTVLNVESVEENGKQHRIPAPDSATHRILVNKQKISLLSALNEVLKERRSVENRRNALLMAGAVRQQQVLELKTKCDAAWQEKIAEAQAVGRKRESICGHLRERREALHKQLLTSLEGSIPARNTQETPSIRANYKMQAVQLQKDIADLKRRVGNAKFRLDTEIKGDVKKLKNEAGAKKIHLGSVRPQILALVSHPAQCRPAREHFRANTTRKRSPIKAKV